MKVTFEWKSLKHDKPETERYIIFTINEFIKTGAAKGSTKLVVGNYTGIQHTQWGDQEILVGRELTTRGLNKGGSTAYVFTVGQIRRDGIEEIDILWDYLTFDPEILHIKEIDFPSYKNALSRRKKIEKICRKIKKG